MFAGTQRSATAARPLQHLGLRFALCYAAVAAALFAVYGFPFELFGVKQDWQAGYLAAYARLAGAVLRLFEPDLIVAGSFIRGRYALEIVRGCDAADINILFVSALVAFPAPFARKLGPLLLGVAALAVANIARICSLFYVGVWAPSWLRAAHEEAWPLLLVAFTVGLFLACVQHLERPRSRGRG